VTWPCHWRGYLTAAALPWRPCRTEARITRVPGNRKEVTLRMSRRLYISTLVSLHTEVPPVRWSTSIAPSSLSDSRFLFH